jgi:transposase
VRRAGRGNPPGAIPAGRPGPTQLPGISGEQGLLGQVEGRTAEDAAYWLYQAGPVWRGHVQVVVIDLCTIYAAAVRRMLPHAALAIDAFHVVQLATKMVGDVRRRVVREKYAPPRPVR